MSKHRVRHSSERRLIEAARDLGYEVERRSSANHIIVRPPRAGAMTLPGKADRTLVMNTLARLRRAVERSA